MADPHLKLAAGAVGRTSVIDDDAVLVNGDHAAGDYVNSANLDPFAHMLLTVQWNSSAPAAGINVANLYNIPGDGAGSELFPEGGDAGIGTDDIPQRVLLVGTFETINPSITVDETLVVQNVSLFFSGNRFVLENVSGQEFDLTWKLDLVPFGFKSPTV